MKTTSPILKLLFTTIIISLILFCAKTANTQTILTLGTDNYTNTSKTYPAPYGNYYYGANNQFLIKASEITALGGTSSLINSIAFQVATAQGEPLNNFTIKIGTTTDNNLSSFNTGLTQVYSSNAYTESSGWNTHIFSTPYQWDGVSNLIIETCFSNSSYTLNALTKYTPTSFTSALFHRKDSDFDCNSSSTTYTSSNRPNMRLSLNMAAQTDDLQIISWESPLSPCLPNANQPITVKLRNAGIAPLQAFDISYSIDGGATFIVENYSGILQAKDTLVYTFSNTAIIQDGFYNCKAAVNTVNDSLNFNDSLSYYLISGASLNGTYSVGNNANDDFATIGEVTNILETIGVSGPVIINLNSGTFNEQVAINGPILGMSNVNNLTFKGNGTIISSANTTFSESDIFRINNQSYITLDSISIISTGVTDNNIGIRITESDYITIKNCNITVPNNIALETICILVSGSLDNIYSSTNTNYLTFENNTTSYGRYALRVNGDYSNHSTNLIIKGNNFINYYTYGIKSIYQDSVIITNNKLSDIGINNFGYSLDINRNNILIVANNKIEINYPSSSYGLSISSCEGTNTNPISVYNNMITSSSPTNNIKGIYIYYAKNINIYHNTISLHSEEASSSALTVSGSSTSGNPENIKIKNNIFANYSNGYAVSISDNLYPTIITEMDYNNLYAPNSTTLAKLNTDYSDLASWQASAVGLDANSISTDPIFAGATDLHASGMIMNNSATPIISINTDIDGELRDITNPDMGADEYTPPHNDVQILSVFNNNSSDCSLNSSELITVIIRNNSVNTKSLIPIKYSINGGSIISETTASINSMQIDTFSFATTADLSTEGIYKIIIYTDLINDENRNNDTIAINTFSIGSIDNFPYHQDFESSSFKFRYNVGHYATAKYDTSAKNGGNMGLIMTGSNNYDWNYTPNNITDAFDITSHVSKFTACNINTSSLSSLNMSFDYKINACIDINYGWFRVMLNNDVYLKDINGDSTWQATDTQGNDPFKKLFFNLNSIIGSQISISLQFIGKYNNEYSLSTNFGNELFIDNIELWETATNDIGLTQILNPKSSICKNIANPVEVVIKNNGVFSETNIPIIANITDPNGNVSIISTTADVTVGGIDTVLVGNINTSTTGIYTLKTYSSLATDTINNDNDTLITTFEIYSPFNVDHVETFDNKDNWNLEIVTKNYNGNYCMYNNYYNNNNSNLLQMTKKIGPISAGDNLVFDYKIKYYNTENSVYFDQDSMFFLISTDCGTSFDTLFIIDKYIHTGSTDWFSKQIPLTAYIGDDIIIGFYGLYGGAGTDYEVLIDNYGVATSPSISLGYDTTVCTGDTVTIHAGYSSGYNYLWMKNGDTLYNTSSSMETNEPGTYIIEVSNPMGTIQDTINIYNYAPTSVSITSLDSSYCIYEDSTLLIGYPSGGILINNYFNPKTAGVGNHEITYTYTDNNNCKNIATTNTIVNDISIINLNTLADVCINTNELIPLGASPINGNWSGNGISNNYFNAAIAGIGSHYLNYTFTNENGCISQDSILQTVNNIPTINISDLSTDYCIDAPAVNLTASPVGNNGIWSGNISSNGEFNPAIVGSGIHTVIYTFTDLNGCSNSDSTTTIVNNLPSINLSPLADVCADENDFTITGATPAGGSWSGNGVSNNIFSVVNSGMHYLTYTFTDNNACTNSDSISLTVNPLPNIYISPLASEYCVDEPAISLTASPNGSGGVWTGSVSSTGVFNPSNYTGSQYLIYTYTDVNGCINYDSITTFINTLPIVSLTTLADVCIDANDFNLYGANPIGGNWSGIGVVNNQFITSSIDSGSYYLTYTYTDTNSCVNSDSIIQTVNSLPEINISSLSSEYCANEPIISLTASPSGIGGIWSGNIASNGEFNPANNNIGVNTAIYTYTDANGCVNSDSTTTIVNALPIISLTTLANVCNDASDFTITGASPIGGIWTGNGVNNNQFSASSLNSGTYNLTYTYTDTNGCINSDSVNQTVNPLPIISISGLATEYCIDADTVSLTANPVGIGGVWSGAANSLGNFIPLENGAGLHTVFYTYTDTNACVSTDSITTLINPLPIITLNSLPDVCNDALNFIITSASPIGGIWTGNGVNNNQFSASSLNSGTYNLTYTFTDTNGCVNSDSAYQTVNPLPIISINGLAPEYCIDAVDVTLTVSPAGIGGVWSGSATTNGEYSPANNGVGSHTIYYTFTDTNSCVNTDSIATIVNALPIITLASLPNVCIDALDFNIIGGSPIGGNWSGNGVNNNIFSPANATNGKHKLTYLFTDTNGCSNSDTINQIVSSLPIVDLGSDKNICENSPSTLDAENIGATYLWNTGDTTQTIILDTNEFGIGDFMYNVLVTDTNMCSSMDSVEITYKSIPISLLTDTITICGQDANITLDAGYTSGNTYLWNNGFAWYSINIDTTDLGGSTGYMNIEITNIYGCINRDSTYVYFRENPSVNLGEDTMVCINHEFTIDAGAGFASYLWNTGAITQSITIDSNTFDIGNNTLKVEVYNDVNCNAMDSMILIVDPCTGVEMPELTNADINIYPNPTKGHFQIEVTGLQNQEYNLDVFNSVGAVVYSDKVSNDSNNKQIWKLDFSTYAKGVYYVRLHSNGDIKVKRIIIN